MERNNERESIKGATRKAKLFHPNLSDKVAQKTLMTVLRNLSDELRFGVQYDVAGEVCREIENDMRK